jgi:hypothetical protein
MGPFFVPAVELAVLGVLGLLLLVAQRGRPTADAAAGTFVFRHSVFLRGFALVATFGIPLGITVLVLLHPPEKEGEVYAVVLVYGLFLGLSLPLLWESILFTLAVSPQGLDCRSPWRGRQFFSWDEVEEVTWSNLGTWFVIRTTEGRTFRVSYLVAGVSEFLGLCEQYLPMEALAGAEPGYNRIGRVFPRTQQQIGRDF